MIKLDFLKSIFTVFNENFKAKKDLEYRESQIEKEAQEERLLNESSQIIIAGDFVEVPGCKVVQKMLPSNCYKKTSRNRAPRMLVVHWDVALSSKSCWSILANRGISTHFSIDNDGTIYQFVDPNDVAWHSGPVSDDIKLLAKKGIKIDKSVSWNNMSIGIDISNAYYLKYQDVYTKSKLGPRPVIKSKCHGMNLEHLGYYPEQIRSFTVLAAVLCKEYGIPAQCPIDPKTGLLSTTIHEDSCRGLFSGIVNHYNLTPNKIDTSGFPLDAIVKSIPLATKGNGK